MKGIPLLIIAHRRPHYLESVLKSVCKASPSRIYVSVDGARQEVEGEKELVSACHGMVSRLQATSKIEVFTRFNDSNLGSAANIIKSIDWFFESEHSGLILEEDCLPDSSITNYMRFNLDRFELEKRVWIVSGYRPEIDGLTTEPCFAHIPMNWGWGTWASKWTEIRKGILESTRDEPILKLPFSSTRNVFWTIGAKRALNGWVDAWDIPLAHAMLKFDKLAYLPPKNLVSNIGTDQFALNTSHKSIFLESKTYCWKNVGNPEDSCFFQETLINRDDSLIEDQMIQIKWTHRFLPIIKYVLQKILKKNDYRGRLSQRV